MTTPERAADYLANHAREWNGRPLAAYNPHGKPIDELPAIYGFNNGGRPGWYVGELIAEDGTPLGNHLCSSEGYMPHDLGCLEGSRPDRHEGFQRHYPDGYRMEFIGEATVMTHPGLLRAVERNAVATATAPTAGEALS